MSDNTMFYLVEALEQYTDNALRELTKLFNNPEAATSYAAELQLDMCGYDYVKITPMTLS